MRQPLLHPRTLGFEAFPLLLIQIGNPTSKTMPRPEKFVSMQMHDDSTRCTDSSGEQIRRTASTSACAHMKDHSRRRTFPYPLNICVEAGRAGPISNRLTHSVQESSRVWPRQVPTSRSVPGPSSVPKLRGCSDKKLLGLPANTSAQSTNFCGLMCESRRPGPRQQPAQPGAKHCCS